MLKTILLVSIEPLCAYFTCSSRPFLTHAPHQKINQSTHGKINDESINQNLTCSHLYFLRCLIFSLNFHLTFTHSLYRLTYFLDFSMLGESFISSVPPLLPKVICLFTNCFYLPTHPVTFPYSVLLHFPKLNHFLIHSLTNLLVYLHTHLAVTCFPNQSINQSLIHLAHHLTIHLITTFI